MNRKIFGLILLCVVSLFIITSSVNAKAKSPDDGATIYNYKLLQIDASKGNNVSRLILTSSMQSIWEAIVYSNAMAKLDVGKFFVCVPENLSMSGKDLLSIMNDYTTRFSDKINPEDKVALIAILALRERFPCN